MEFRIAKQEFLKGLQLMTSVVVDKDKGALPTLANVHIKSLGPKQLRLAATDLNVSVVALVTAEVSEEGEFMVDAKTLHSHMATAQKEMTVKVGPTFMVEVKSGRANWKVPGQAAATFPKINSSEKATFQNVDTALFRTMIDQTLFSVCTDISRHHMTGCYLEAPDNTAVMVSTDGTRLTVSKKVLGLTLKTGIIVPKKGLTEAKRFLDASSPCRMAVEEHTMFVEQGNVALTIRLIEGTFPPYQQVIPQNQSNSALMKRVELTDALRRVRVATDEAKGVRVTFTANALELVSRDPIAGEVREEIDAQYIGPKIVMGLNPTFMLDLLTHMVGDQVVISFADEKSPGLVRSADLDDFLGIIMPMRVD